jgi:hypothetical protein
MGILLYCTIAILHKQLICLPAIEEYHSDIRGRQYSVHIIRLNILYAAVRRAYDITGCYHIPQRYIVAQQKVSFFRDRSRLRLPQHCREHFPETVLRMSVIKLLLPRLDRGHGAQDQDP